jgi:hypothetical protein
MAERLLAAIGAKTAHYELLRLGKALLDSDMVWRSRLALTGFLAALGGLSIILPVVRLLALLIFAVDYGMTSIELAGVPACVVGMVFCLLGLRNGIASRLSRLGLQFAAIGLLFAVLLTIAILTFDGGSV